MPTIKRPITSPPQFKKPVRPKVSSSERPAIEQGLSWIGKMLLRLVAGPESGRHQQSHQSDRSGLGAMLAETEADDPIAVETERIAMQRLAEKLGRLASEQALPYQTDVFDEPPAHLRKLIEQQQVKNKAAAEADIAAYEQKVREAQAARAAQEAAKAAQAANGGIKAGTLEGPSLIEDDALRHLGLDPKDLQPVEERKPTDDLTVGRTAEPVQGAASSTAHLPLSLEETGHAPGSLSAHSLLSDFVARVESHIPVGASVEEAENEMWKYMNPPSDSDPNEKQ